MAASFTTFAQIGIGTTTPHASAALDITASDKGFLLPRVTSPADINETPVNGLMIYDTTDNCVKVFQKGAWSGCLFAPVPATYTLTDIDSYNGTSVINTTGIGYNGEAVPAESTIIVNANVVNTGSYNVSATDATTGLEYSAIGLFTGQGTQTIQLMNNKAVIPELTRGVISMILAGDADNDLVLEPRIDIKSISGSSTKIEDVTYGTQTWMDRNLGAIRVATAVDDILSYGNYYQWGRPADGHETIVRNGTTPTTSRGLNNTMATLATTDEPAHGEFITNNTSPFDWRNDNNNGRWETVNQGPCPTGYHVPTKGEWDIADAAALGSENGTNGTSTTGWDNNVETFESALKLPSAGRRNLISGLLNGQGTFGRYWSSTVSGTDARYLYFSSSAASTPFNSRAHGLTVRCLKNN